MSDSENDRTISRFSRVVTLAIVLFMKSVEIVINSEWTSRDLISRMNFRRTVSALDIEFKCLTRIHKTRYFIISIKFLWLLVNVKRLNDHVCIPNDFSTQPDPKWPRWPQNDQHNQIKNDIYLNNLF